MSLRVKMSKLAKGYAFATDGVKITDGEALRAVREKLLKPGQHTVDIRIIQETLTNANELLTECNRSLEKVEVDQIDYAKVCAIKHACSKMLDRPDLRTTQRFQAA